MLYIRTDMNSFIATGHVMRCLAIADALTELGENTTFILADEQALGLIRDRGYHAITLHTEWNHMEKELDALQLIIKEKEIKTLLIDSYMVTPDYLHELSKWVHIIYIDDLDAFDYPVQTIICYANYWEKFRYMERYMKTRLLLGPQYTPLRKSFKNIGKKEIKQSVDNILLMSGGTDHFSILMGLLDKINKEKYQNIDVICGKFYSEYEQLCCRFGQCANIHIHKGVNDIENYMMRADVAVSAGGSCLYELCACGTPTVSYSIADNQLDNVMQFQKDHLIDYAGDVRNTNIFERVIYFLCEYDSKYKLRIERSRKMQKLVDGKGAERIAKELFCQS